MVPTKIKFLTLSIIVIATSFFAFKASDSLYSNTFTTTKNTHVELGDVQWERDFEKGLSKAAKTNKPVFLLFQEVPGCSTCRSYGQDVLSHPQIVEAIETLFIPVAIFNNKKGKDAEVLKYYSEPSWNNPVVRIVDSKKKNIVQRVAGNYSKLGVVHAMTNALREKELVIPTYLKLLQQSLEAKSIGTETATFSMFCFWTGEKELGKLDGVVETQAGWMNGKEVVEVTYNPILISYEELLSSANKSSCANHVFTENQKQDTKAENLVGKKRVSKKSKFRLDKEPKYYLSNSIYRFIPMTQLQAAKVNSKIGKRQSPEEYLSPRQLKLLDLIKKNPNKKWKSAINISLEKAWKKIEEKKKS